MQHRRAYVSVGVSDVLAKPNLTTTRAGSQTCLKHRFPNTLRTQARKHAWNIFLRFKHRLTNTIQTEVREHDFRDGFANTYWNQWINMKHRWEWPRQSVCIVRTCKNTGNLRQAQLQCTKHILKSQGINMKASENGLGSVGVWCISQAKLLRLEQACKRALNTKLQMLF